MLESRKVQRGQGEALAHRMQAETLDELLRFLTPTRHKGHRKDVIKPHVTASNSCCSSHRSAQL